MRIQWYPGHMTAARRMLEDNIKVVDVVLLVMDARVPRASLNTDLTKLAKNKPLIYILNKADLADAAVTARWVAFLQQGENAQAVALSAKNSQQGLQKIIWDVTAPLRERAQAKGAKKIVRVLAAGIPNAGKSTLLNSIAGRAGAKTGNKPGVTRGKQWIHVTDHLELLDSPGLLVPKIATDEQGENLALTGAINDDILDKEELAFALIKRLCVRYPKALPARYGLEEAGNDEPLAVFDGICKKRGCLLKGGLPDYARGAELLISDFRAGRIGRLSLEAPDGNER